MKGSLRYVLATIIVVSFCFLSLSCAKKQTVKEPTRFPPTTTRTPTVLSPEPKVYEPPSTTRRDLGATKEVALEMIHFEFDMATLTEDARLILARNARELKNNQPISLMIEGHCDERGTSEYNLALGERRAKSARDYLLTFGVSPDRISIISYGEERPLIDLSSEYAWAKNRRAEFKIDNTGMSMQRQ